MVLNGGMLFTHIHSVLYTSLQFTNLHSVILNQSYFKHTQNLYIFISKFIFYEKIKTYTKINIIR